MIAEVLRQSSNGEVSKLKVAGLILICRERCWPDFIAMDDFEKEWAVATLRGFVTNYTSSEVKEYLRVE